MEPTANRGVGGCQSPVREGWQHPGWIPLPQEQKFTLQKLWIRAAPSANL